MKTIRFSKPFGEKDYRKAVHKREVTRLDIERIVLIYETLTYSSPECKKYTERFIESYVTYNGETLQGSYIIITNLIRGKELNKKREPKKSLDLLKIAQEIMEVLKYIHKYGVSHNDITTKNIMYDESDDRYKLIDYGYSCNCNNPVLGENQTAPEIFYSKNDITGMSDNFHKSDLWGLGTILYTLSSGKYYYGTKQDFKKELVTDRSHLEKNYEVRIEGEVECKSIPSRGKSVEIDYGDISNNIRPLIKALMIKHWRERFNYVCIEELIKRLKTRIERDE